MGVTGLATRVDVRQAWTGYLHRYDMKILCIGGYPNTQGSEQ